MRPLDQRLYVRAFAQRFVHHELPLAGRLCQHPQQFVQRPLVEILGPTQAVAADFHGTNRLLKCFLIRLADAHRLADRQHLRAQPILQAGEFFERPTAEFDDHIIAPRRILFQRPAAPIRDLVQRQSARQQGRHIGDGKAGRLGSQGRRTRGARIDFDGQHAVGPGVMGELDVRAPNHADRLDDGVGILLQPLL